MKTDVGEIRRQPLRRFLPTPIMQAKIDMMSPKQVIDFGFVPSRIPEFEDAGVFARKRLQEAVQPRRINVPVGRKLEQNRTELSLE